MNQKYNLNNNFKNDESILNYEESDYQDLISRLKEIKSNITLLEKTILR